LDKLLNPGAASFGGPISLNFEMSAFGPKRTSLVALHMSAFGGKADMAIGSDKMGYRKLCDCLCYIDDGSGANFNSWSFETAMSDEDLKAELERLRNENAALKKGAASGIRMKVSEKGAVSIYGMGRFPVTLYREQWLKLLDMSDDIRAFIAANEAQLKTKHHDK
jgi:hypothetical protein